MKFFVFALLVAVVLCNQALIDEVNNANAGWTAGRTMFTDMSSEQRRKYLGALPSVPTMAEEISLPIELPDTFDSRTQWPGCVGSIRDQQQCGSCWAFSLAEVMSDRLCIGMSKNGIIVAPQDSVSCDKSNYGCQGGYLNLCWAYAANTGDVTEGCFPYVSGNGAVPACPYKCKNGADWTGDKHKASNVKTFTNEQAIMQEIYTNGPIQVGFSVYADFFNYKSGVYKHVSGSLEGGHAVKNIGWGVTSDGTKYWIIANSWNTNWGMNGYFWILKGKNECGIESQGYAGTMVQ
jgi:cathepsin B